LSGAGYKVVQVTAKVPVQTLPEFDALIDKDMKGMPRELSQTQRHPKTTERNVIHAIQNRTIVPGGFLDLKLKTLPVFARKFSHTA